MKYSYPKISNTLTYQRMDDDTVEVVDHITDDRFAMDIDAVRFVRKLDGFTNPYKIPTVLSREEIDETLDFIKENDLVRYRDTMHLSFGNVLKTLWIPKRSLRLKRLACLTNFFLMLLWLPLPILGVVMFANNIKNVEFGGIWVGFFIGLIFGMVFHEFGHAFAGLAYGAAVFEMGVMLMYCVIPGAYVILNSNPVKNRMKRVQINAAGVEMNFLLFGAFLILGAVFPLMGGMFLCAAICNGMIGAINLTLLARLDGAAIMSDLLGVEDMIGWAKRILFNRKERRKLLRSGSGGVASVSLCYMLLALQLVWPIFLITNVLEVVACFF